MMGKYRGRLFKISFNLFVVISCVYVTRHVLPILCQVFTQFRIRTHYQDNGFAVKRPNYGTQLKKIEDGFVDVVKEYFDTFEEYKQKLQIKKQDEAWISNEEASALPRLPSSCKKNNFLLILIHSAPLNFEQRLSIRFGWGLSGNTESVLARPFQDTDYTDRPPGLSRLASFRYLFVVGRSSNENNTSTNSLLRQEARHFDDILYLDFEDNYHTLTLKTIQSLNWASENCMSDFILKTDDDCYVNTKAISTFLTKKKTSTKRKHQNLYTGRVQWAMPAIRDLKSKFFVPYHVYPYLLLPPYVSGGGYLFSGHLLQPLLETNRRVKTIPNEDSHIGYLMKYIGIKPVENYHFLPYIYCNESIWERPACDFVKPFVIHGVQNYGQLWMHYHVTVLSNIRGVCKQSNKARKHVTIPLYCPVNLEM